VDTSWPWLVKLKRALSRGTLVYGACEVDTPWAWLIVFTSFLLYSVSMACYNGTTGVFFSAFLHEFKANHSTTAIVSSLTNAMHMGNGIFAGYLTNRWGCRTVVMLGSVCIGTAFVGTSFSRSITLIYLTQGVLKGLGVILTLQPVFVIVSEYHVKRRTLAMGIVSTGSGLGTAVGASLSEFLITSLGWRWACRVLGCVFSIITTLAAMTFVPIDLTNPNAPKRSTQLKLGELFKIRAFRYFCLPIAIYGCYVTAQITFITNFAESMNISPMKAAALWIYWGIASTGGRLFGGIFKSSPLIRLRDFTVAGLGMGFSSWLLALNFEGYPTYIVFVISQILNGWLMGMFYHLAPLCIADVFGVENVSLGIGVFYTMQMPAAVVGLPLLGFVSDKADGKWTPSFQILAVVQSISGLLMLWFYNHARLIIIKKELETV